MPVCLYDNSPLPGAAIHTPPNISPLITTRQGPRPHHSRALAPPPPSILRRPAPGPSAAGRGRRHLPPPFAAVPGAMVTPGGSAGPGLSPPLPRYVPPPTQRCHPISGLDGGHHRHRKRLVGTLANVQWHLQAAGSQQQRSG